MRNYKLFVFFFLSGTLAAQKNPNPNCDSLMLQKVYDEAIDCYETKYKQNPTGPAFEKLLQAFLVVEDSAAAIKLTKRQSKEFGHLQPQYYVHYWHLAKVLGRRGPDFAILENLTRNNPFTVRATVQQLERYGYLQEGIDLFLLAESIKPQINTAYERAQLHAQLGQYEAQYEAYLLALNQNRGYLATIEAKIAQNLSFDATGVHSSTLRKVLLRAIAQNPRGIEERLYLFVLRQEGDFEQAIAYLKAKSKREEMPVEQLYEVGLECAEMEQWELANQCFDFLLSDPTTLRYVGRLDAVLVAQANTYTASNNLIAFNRLLERYPIGTEQGLFNFEVLRAEAIFNQSPGREQDLTKLLTHLDLLRNSYSNEKQRGITYTISGNAQRLMGDYDEALMDYARAEMLLGDSDEGDIARLQKALCAFYSGDILWAKTQLEVLLKSSSKSISNDAMEFALLISANSVEDTLMEGLVLIKDAMLLESQNRLDSAIEVYESKLPILLVHELYDDLLFRLGKLYERTGDYNQARSYFLQLNSIASRSMWKEEAAFYPAKMAYRLQLPEAQQELEDYLVAYPAGIFTEDARQFYRTFTP